MADENHDDTLDDLAGLDEIVKEAENVDGYYELDETPEGVFLCVHPPQGDGFPVSHTKVEKELDLLGITEVDIAKLSEVVAKKAGEKVLIAPPQASRDQDAVVEVTISENKMKADVVVTGAEGDGQPVTEDMINAALKEAEVTFGIGDKALKDLVANEVYGESLQIAAGIEPEKGKDGVIEYQFRTEKVDLKPTELEDGSVDFYNLDMVENVIEGQVVAIQIPPQEGTPGKDVLGNEIEAEPGKTLEFSIGKNVKVSEEDETLLVATVSGQAALIDKRVSIVEVYNIKGDVDYSTGNITFVGSVVIKGNVRSGFVIKAGENVEIHGMVENAKIEAGGDVIVRGGIFGQETGEIDAEGDVKIKFIENAIVRSKCSITVGKAIMHSRVVAENEIIIGGKGVLVGGQASAGKKIKARILGSRSAVTTDIEVGVNPTLKEEYFALRETVQTSTQNHEKITKGIKTLGDLKTALKENFPPDKQVMLDKLIETDKQLTNTIEVSKTRLEELEKRIDEMRGGVVGVGEHIFPGVKVTIGKSVRRFDQEVKGLRNNFLKEKQGEIILTS